MFSFSFQNKEWVQRCAGVLLVWVKVGHLFKNLSKHKELDRVG